MICAIMYAAVCGVLFLWDQRKTGPESESCRLCSGQLPEGLYLLDTVSGQLYWLDPPKEMTAREGLTITYGNDPVSGRAMEITRMVVKEQKTDEEQDGGQERKTDGDQERILLRWVLTGAREADEKEKTGKSPETALELNSALEGGADEKAETPKKWCCEDCSEKIAMAAAKQQETEFVLFDAKEMTFYAGTEGTRQIGECEVHIVRHGDACELLVRP